MGVVSVVEGSPTQQQPHVLTKALVPLVQNMLLSRLTSQRELKYCSMVSERAGAGHRFWKAFAARSRKGLQLIRGSGARSLVRSWLFS